MLILTLGTNKNKCYRVAYFTKGGLCSECWTTSSGTSSNFRRLTVNFVTDVCICLQCCVVVCICGMWVWKQHDVYSYWSFCTKWNRVLSCNKAHNFILCKKNGNKHKKFVKSMHPDYHHDIGDSIKCCKWKRVVEVHCVVLYVGMLDVIPLVSVLFSPILLAWFLFKKFSLIDHVIEKVCIPLIPPYLHVHVRDCECSPCMCVHFTIDWYCIAPEF